MQTLSIDAFNIVGIEIRTTNVDYKGAEEIGAMWGRFLSEGILQQIPNKVDDTIYSLYTEYETDHTGAYTAVLGCKVTSTDNIPEGMVSKRIEGGNYAKLTAKGDLTQGLIANKWNEIWEMDLKRTYTTDYEVFGENKASNPSDAEVDFLIAVE